MSTGGQTTYEVVVQANDKPLQQLAATIRATSARMLEQAGAAEASSRRQVAAAAEVGASADKMTQREAAAFAKRQAAMEAWVQKTKWGNQQAAAAADARAQQEKAAAAASHAAAQSLRDMEGIGGGASVSLKGVAMAAAGAAAAIAAVTKAAMDGAFALGQMAAEGEKLKTIEAAFTQLGGTADEMKKLREMTGNMVGDTDLQKAMNLAKLFKLPAEEIPKLIRVAQGAAVAMGETTAKMLNDTFTATSRQSKMIADNMGIVIGDMDKMYSEFARGIGKTKDQLTDQEKSMAFTRKMISEGERQMGLATLAQGNAAEAAAVQWDNFTGEVQVGIAELFRSMGVWDSLGGHLDAMKGLLNDNAGAIKDALAPMFKGLSTIIPAAVKALAAFMPLLEPLGKLLSFVGAALEYLAPLFGIISTVAGKTASFVIDLVALGLEPLLRAASEVASLLSDDMAAGFDRAADAIGNARTYLDANTEAIKEQVPAVEAAVEGWGALARAMERVPGAVAPADEVLAGLASRLRGTGAWSITTEKVNGLAQAMEFWAAQAKGRGLEGAEAQRWAAESLAKSWGMSAESAKKAATDIMQTHEALLKSTETAAQAQARAQQEAAAASIKDQTAMLEEMRAIYFAAGAAQGEYADLTNKIWADAGGDEKAALEALDKWRESHMAAAGTAYVDDAEQYAHAVQMIAHMHERAMSAMGLADTSAIDDLMARAEKAGKSRKELAKMAARQQFETDMAAARGNAEAVAAAEKVYEAALKEGEGGGGRGGKRAKRDDGEYQLRLALADEMGRKIMEIEKRYTDLASKAKEGDAETRTALARKMADEIAKIEADAARKLEDERAKVIEFGMGRAMAEHQRKLREIKRQAEEMREAARAAGMGDEAVAGIDAKEQALLQEEAMRPMREMGSRLMGLVEGAGSSVSDMFHDTLKEMEDATAARTQRMADLFETMGTSIGTTLVQVATSSEDMREKTFKVMGQLFGQLSTAFLAWAKAEGGLLSGNPFAAAGAAIALGVVGAAISSFGSRGKGGGTSGMARQSMDRRKDDNKERDASVVIYNYGFSTPDQIARSVARGEMRGRELDGRSKRAA